MTQSDCQIDAATTTPETPLIVAPPPQPSPRRKRSRAALDEPLVIGIDTREQEPYSFASVRNPVIAFDPSLHIERITMPTGDYTAVEHRTEIVIERKSKADAYGSFGRERDRFEAEIARMGEIIRAGGYAAVVIEADWYELLTDPPPHSSKMKPKSIIATAIAWEQRYGVHFHAVRGRELAEQWVFRTIERWVRDRRGA